MRTIRIMTINKKSILLSFICLFVFLNCAVKKTKETTNNDSIPNIISTPIQEHSMKAVLWQQLSGEYRALSYQAFNLAKLQLDKIIEAEKENEKPLAIITDIDETVLNNSPFLGKLIELDENFSKQRWIDWGMQISANSVPGALEFFQYAASKNIEIFYISNRYDIQLNETIINLNNIHFPNANKSHVLLKKINSGKQPRREKVLESHKVVMLLGDNLSDFSMVFESNSIKQRNRLVDDFKAEFGKKFIVLPNPMYGDWEGSGIYGGTYDWTPIEKDSIRASKLISY